VSAKAVLLFTCGSLLAHDLYLRPATFQPKPGQTIQVEYHNGDNFPMSDVATKIERLREMELRGADGRAPFTNFRIEGPATVADVLAPKSAGMFWLVSRTQPNLIELVPAKFEDYLAHKGLHPIVEWRKNHGEAAKPGREIYSKYVKALGYVESPVGDISKPIGFPIEIVPLANPYTRAAADTLPIRVLVRGKAQSGVAVEISHADGATVSLKPAIVTDAKGEASIPIGPRGLWKLHTIFMERRDGKEADWESYWASLTFELPNR
jgi:uncharacterized GH25 family protein